MHSAERLLFARVESAYSPRRQSGYQTVARSAGLEESEIEVIQDRVKTLRKVPAGLVRRQYFWLDSGRCVFTATRFLDSTLAEYAHIIDESRRPAFLAQCLVLDETAFARLSYHPFRLFDQEGLFLSDEEFLTLVQAIRDRQGAPALEQEPLRVKRIHPTHEESPWPAEDRLKLVALARQADREVKDGRSVLLLGEEDDVLGALRLVFEFVKKPEERRACTFDTYIRDCGVAPGRYWAVGSPGRETSPGFLDVDATERKVRVEVRPGESDRYTTWLVGAFEQADQQRVQEYAPTIHYLAQVYENLTPATPEEELVPAACAEFFALFPDCVLGDLGRRLLTRLPSSLARRLLAFLQPRLESGRLAWWKWLSEPGIPDTELAELVTAWMVEDHPRWGLFERSSLRKLARRAEAWPLLFWTTCLGWLPHHRDRRLALASMDQAGFQTALALLCQPIAPHHFVSATHVPALLQALQQYRLADRTVVGLVAAIVACGAGKELAPLAGRVAGLRERWLRKLEKRIQGQANLAPEFVQAVQARRSLPGISLGALPLF
jgi:hypothetical protein